MGAEAATVFHIMLSILAIVGLVATAKSLEVATSKAVGVKMLDIIWAGILMGIGGTAFMDIWAIILHRFFHQPAPNWGPVGRWFWHLPKGKVFHDSIANAAPYAHENALGWASHYAIGIVYGVVLALIVPDGWFAAPTFWLPWLVGIVTVAAGWFLLQPGLGIGWAASKTPNPWKVRALNLVAHTIFAFGMFATALLLI